MQPNVDFVNIPKIKNFALNDNIKQKFKKI